MIIKPNRRSLITGAAALSAYAWLRKPTEAALSINNLNGFGVKQPGGGGITWTGHTATSESGSDLTTYTFSGMSISTAAANRQVAVASFGRGSGGTISSATIGGVSATISSQVTTSGSIVGILIATVPTGTTADVAVTYSTSQARAACATFVMYGASTTANDTATDTSSPYTQSLNIPATGVGIAAHGNASNTTSTWTNLTEDLDAVFAEDPQHYTAASDQFASEQTALSITCTPGASVQPATVFVSYGPA